MAYTIMRAASRTSWRAHSLLSSRIRPIPHPRVRLKSIPIRIYNTSPHLQDYPKEGVFQPNSPPRQPQQPTTSGLRNQTQPSPHYSPEPPPPPQGRSTRSRALRYAFRGLVFLVFTVYGFTFLTAEGLSRAPLPFPPGSPEDREELALLAEEYDALPLVQDLRSLHRVLPNGQQERVWKEWVAYRGYSDPTSRDASVERRENMLSTGPLKGSAGLAAQSVFCNEETGQILVFVNFGEGVCGWPGVVHGGAIATIADEALGRCAHKNAQLDSNREKKEEGEAEERTVVTAKLQMNYLERIEPGQWFAMLCQLGEGTGKPDTSKVEGDFVVDYDAPVKPTKFTGTSAVSGRRGFDRKAPILPSRAVSAETPEPIDPTATPTEPPPPSEAPPSPSSALGSDDPEIKELSIGFQRSTTKKKFGIGIMFCASEVGPTWEGLEHALGNADLESRLEAGVHVHAYAEGLWVVKEGMRGPPEEF